MPPGDRRARARALTVTRAAARGPGRARVARRACRTARRTPDRAARSARDRRPPRRRRRAASSTSARSPSHSGCVPAATARSYAPARAGPVAGRRERDARGDGGRRACSRALRGVAQVVERAGRHRRLRRARAPRSARQVVTVAAVRAVAPAEVASARVEILDALRRLARLHPRAAARRVGVRVVGVERDRAGEVRDRETRVDRGIAALPPRGRPLRTLRDHAVEMHARVVEASRPKAPARRPRTPGRSRCAPACASASADDRDARRRRARSSAVARNAGRRAPIGMPPWPSSMPVGS